jgi:membrane protein involved in colicin uptake
MRKGSQAEDLAAQAAEAVRRAVAEGEAKAEQIVRDAEVEAKRIRDEAEAEARERIERASKALEELRGQLGAVGNTPGPSPAASPPAASEPEPEPLRAEPEVPTARPTESRPAASGNGDDAAARLVAMKLAVDGKGREEIEAELTERFGPGDRSGLLDDVLTRAGR